MSLTDQQKELLASLKDRLPTAAIERRGEVKCWDCGDTITQPAWKIRDICSNCFAQEDGHNDR